MLQDDGLPSPAPSRIWSVQILQAEVAGQQVETNRVLDELAQLAREAVNYSGKRDYLEAVRVCKIIPLRTRESLSVRSLSTAESLEYAACIAVHLLVLSVLRHYPRAHRCGVEGASLPHRVCCVKSSFLDHVWRSIVAPMPLMISQIT